MSPTSYQLLHPAPYSTHISLSGNNTFQRGIDLQELTIDPSFDFGSPIIEGAGSTNSYFQRRIQTIDSLMDANYHNILEKSYANTVSNSITYSDEFNAAIRNINTSDTDIINNSNFSKSRI